MTGIIAIALVRTGRYHRGSLDGPTGRPNGSPPTAAMLRRLDLLVGR
jgi:hypothetical protein